MSVLTYQQRAAILREVDRLDGALARRAAAETALEDAQHVVDGRRVQLLRRMFAYGAIDRTRSVDDQELADLVTAVRAHEVEP